MAIGHGIFENYLAKHIIMLQIGTIQQVIWPFNKLLLKTIYSFDIFLEEAR